MIQAPHFNGLFIIERCSAIASYALKTGNSIQPRHHVAFRTRTPHGTFVYLCVSLYVTHLATFLDSYLKRVF